MARFTAVINATDDHDADYLIEDIRFDRLARVRKIVKDLLDFGVSQGFSEAQTEAAVDDLFNTYNSEWSIYILVGATGIIDALTNDTTLTWLDLDASGQTIRTRLIARL